MLYMFVQSIRIFLLISILLSLTGCWSRIEINDRTFVTGVYVDRLDNGNVEVSLGFPLPNRYTSAGGPNTGAEGNGNPYTIISKSAESIPVAIRKIRSDLTREISWGHCRVIVVGRKMAESGIDSILEFVAREPNFHTKTYFMVAPGKGSDIGKLTPVFERLPSEILREFGKRRVTLDTSIKDILEAEVTGGDTIAAMLSLGEKEMISEKGNVGAWVGTNGAALFQDSKMVATFNMEEMRAGLWIQGKMKSSLNSLKSPTDGKMISFIILQSKSKIMPRIQNNKINFDIHIQAEDDIQSSESNIDLNDPKQIIVLQDMLSVQLKERIMNAITKTQTLGIDVFNFGRYVDWWYPKVWNKHKKNWRSTYKNCEINVSTHVVVKRMGSEKNPIIREEGE
ncbi:Ger(x)C family spore germination protein [Paenibacillus sp. N3.4]|uniref:Ger(x)C family spore germination protein n=1 Tax=Paenibacillus sp. N3.4 TaxID=2603222 RepID=UPI0011C90D43|nr:Ger(x)C family spore germination protein [Paenibacillus sp. N3.4]TXK83685.1 Ger(x)C family spore germination protein [Paenibacillus sp. N3.4]